MATLWIEEEPDIPLAGRGVAPVHDATLGNNVEQKITIGAATTLSGSAFIASTNYITMHSDLDCYFDIGLAPVATTSTKHLLAGVERTFKVKSGWKVAVKDET